MMTLLLTPDEGQYNYDVPHQVSRRVIIVIVKEIKRV